ncbi:MAG: serine/threonine-protein kinase [Gemmatimonadota bacterium]|nr:serine/threonine-protein kinase [Gemmatimonadota bacterium]
MPGHPSHRSRIDPLAPDAPNSLARLTAALSDRYRLERELGAGGMATVYLAQDLKHDRQVAIKVLRPELAAVIGAERFLSEIKTTANLQHPHILPLFDSGIAVDSAARRLDGSVGDSPAAESPSRRDAEFLFYVMPFIEGESLRDRLSREKQLPIADAIRIATEIAGALDYAHRHNVIHRDIKPENILLHDGRALVADFGIALAASKAGGSRMTETGMSLGTPTYMSPEQAMGEREITARSDVYALGCVLYEMLIGEPPFNGPTAQAIVAKVMTAEPASLAAQRKSIPPQVEGSVFTALEKLPADRFASAAEFAAALVGDGMTARRHDGRSVTGRAAESPGRPVRGTLAGYADRPLGLAPAHGRAGDQPAAGDALAAYPGLPALARRVPDRDPGGDCARWIEHRVRRSGERLLPAPAQAAPRGRQPAARRDGRRDLAVLLSRWPLGRLHGAGRPAAEGAGRGRGAHDPGHRWQHGLSVRGLAGRRADHLRGRECRVPAGVE